MLKPCPHHFDPTCDNCRASMPEDQKRVDVLTEVQNKEVKEKKSGILATVVGWSVATALLGGLTIFFCYILVPGFLKPDKEVTVTEVTVTNVSSFRDYVIVDYIYDDVMRSDYLDADRLEAVLRTDGKNYTTAILKNRESEWRFDSMTILVPFQEDLEKWNALINQCRAQKSQIRTPKRIVP